MNQSGSASHFLLEHFEHDHRQDHDSDSDSSGLITAKATAMCVLFVASTLCGCGPFLLDRWFKWTQRTQSENVRSAIVVKFLLYFGGGVLICTTFQHLVPEVTHNIETLQKCKLLPTLTFHLPHLLMCMGFFTMYFVEEIIHAYIHKYRKRADLAQNAFERGHSIRDSILIKGRSNGEKNSLSKDNLVASDLEGLDIDLRENKIEGCVEHKCDGGHSHLPVSSLSGNTIISSLRGLLVVLALSLHELFEGLAVGLESEPGAVWYMFGAVSAHKLVLAFCVGVELIATGTKLWLSIVYVLTFAVVSPLGIGIGICVSDSDASVIPSAMLQGLASGTLLYVVFFEILSKERSGLIAYAAFLIGFVVMFGLQLATTGSHGHSHMHCHSHEGGEDDHDHNH